MKVLDLREISFLEYPLEEKNVICPIRFLKDDLGRTLIKLRGLNYSTDKIEDLIPLSKKDERKLLKLIKEHNELVKFLQKLRRMRTKVRLKSKNNK